ncbi:MAG: c-type cytochrome [Betaproteobacteria bacterium]
MKTFSILLLTSAALLSLGAQAATGEEVMTKSGCMACHKVDAKLVGPALKDIGKKYKGKDVLATLMAKVRAGGSGVYGPIPMAPNPVDKISDADLKTAVQWVLSL